MVLGKEGFMSSASTRRRAGEPGRLVGPASARPALSLTREESSDSAHWFERAKAVLAGGVSSSARAATAGSRPYPMYVDRARGSSIWSVEGDRYIDFLMSYGSLVLGHGHPAVAEAVSAQLERGTMFGACSTPEVELAEEICRLVPCASLVRLANSGSEAMSGAIRAARGFTGRSKVLKFEGHYHGWVDVLAVSNRPTLDAAGPAERPVSCAHSRGIPDGVVEDVIVCPWNDIDALDAILDANAGEIAAVVAEPIVANNACTMPIPGFLGRVRETCTRRGVLLIFDEIVTGFRVSLGGAQELFGVVPDLATYSKAIGGGLPVAAFCGRREVMDLVATNTVKHGGTYNGNPLGAAAACATLRALGQPGVLDRVHRVAESVSEAIRRAAHDYGVACVVQGAGGMFQIVFGVTTPLRNYRDLLRADSKRFAAFWQHMFDQGVFANSSGSACWFASAAHTDDDVARVCAAVRAAMARVA
jgi:glutamate-1-semialdehyde 2,1-aminomutase